MSKIPNDEKKKPKQLYEVFEQLKWFEAEKKLFKNTL